MLNRDWLSLASVWLPRHEAFFGLLEVCMGMSAPSIMKNNSENMNKHDVFIITSFWVVLAFWHSWILIRPLWTLLRCYDHWGKRQHWLYLYICCLHCVPVLVLVHDQRVVSKHASSKCARAKEVSPCFYEVWSARLVRNWLFCLKCGCPSVSAQSQRGQTGNTRYGLYYYFQATRASAAH